MVNFQNSFFFIFSQNKIIKIQLNVVYKCHTEITENTENMSLLAHGCAVRDKCHTEITEITEI